MAKNNNILLIHKNMDPITLEKSVDIILTPQFYTFLREDLDLKFAYQAKQIAPSLFDDYVKSTEEHQFHVYKCENNWCFIAYKIDEIDKFLESIGIEKHRVSKIYFTQQIADEFEKPILLSDKEVLQNIEGTVTLIPKHLMESDIEYNHLDTDKLKLKGGVTMGASLNSFVSLKETILLSSLFFILGSVFIVEGQRIKSSISNEDAQLTALLDNNPKYGSKLRRDSILEKYKPIDKIEREKRQAIKDISKLLSAKSQLKTLLIDKQKIQAEIVIEEESINQQVREHAENKQFRVSGSEKNMKVEKSL